MVTFRDWNMEDASALYEVSKDPLLQQSWNHHYLYPSTINKAKQCIAFYRQADQRRFYIQAIVYQHQVCGYIQCAVKDAQKGELSYYLASHYHNQGIMTTAIPLFCKACFDRLPMTMLYARVDKKNKASQIVLLRNNFIEYEKDTVNIYLLLKDSLRETSSCKTL